MMDKIIMACDRILTSIRCLEQDISELRVEVEILKRHAKERNRTGLTPVATIKGDA